MFSQAFCTRHVVASRGASSHQEWESTREGWLESQGSPQAHWSTRLWQKQNLPEKKKKKVQNTSVIGFLKTSPNVLVWSPQTQWLAQDISRGHKHWLMGRIRTRRQNLILFWATWTGISTTAITAATSKSWPATFAVKDSSPWIWCRIRLHLGASSA